MPNPPAYTLHFDTIGTETDVTRRIITDVTDDLAREIHWHARGILNSPSVDIELDGLHGTVYRAGSLAGAFTLTPDAPAATPPAIPGAIRHGYTLHDLDSIARTACAADRTLASSMTGRYDTAWSAIAEALCAADDPPQREDLVRAGLRGIYEEIRLCRRMYGVDTIPRSGAVASAPRFRAYWTNRPDDIADRIVERIAVHQVVAALTPARREAVTALAVHDDYLLASTSLGLSKSTFAMRIKDGRDQARRLWYAPEAVPSVKSRDRRVGSRSAPDSCPQGHPYTAENTMRSRKHRERRCRTCHQAWEADRYARMREAAA